METAQAKILIVEDDPQIRMMLQKFLSKHGFQIVLADDGLKGVKSFNEEHPNLVLLDTLLPKLMGFDVCDMIKGSPEGKSTPVVMMSAVCRAEKFQTEAKSKHRADHFLVKPFQFSEMISVIEGLLGQSKETLTMPAATMPTRPPPVGPHSKPRPTANPTIVSGPSNTFVASPPPLPSSRVASPPPFAGARQVSFTEAPPAHDVLDIIDTAEETTDPIELDQSELTPVNMKAPHASNMDDFEIPAAEPSPPDTVIVEFETDNSDEETSLTPPPTAPRRGPEVEIEFTPAPAPAPAQFVDPPPAPTFTGDVRYGLSRPERPTESLGEQPLAALFQTLGAKGFSGALEVTHDGTTRRVFWQGGKVAFVEPLSRSENVGRFLVKSGKITDADYSRALEAMMDSAGSMEDALVASGAVAAADLPAVISDAVRDRAMSLFAWGESTFQTTPEATPPPGSPDAALDPVVLAFHALCRQLPDDWVTAKLATIRSKRVTPTEAFDQMSPRLDALRIPAAITDGLGKLTVAQIAGADPNDAHALFRCLRAMIELGWVAIEGEARRNAATPPSHTPPPEAVPVESSASETSIPASPEASFELTATPTSTAAAAPETAEAFFRRGEKLLKEGAFATALVAFTNALKANPKEPEYYLYLGWAMYQNYRGSGRADMETRAINFVRRALVMNPNFDQGYFILGRIYQEKGKPDQAKQLYAKTIFINPSHGEALAAMRTLPK